MFNDAIQGIYRGSDNRSSLYDIRLSNVTQNPELVVFAHGYKGFKDWGPWNLVSSQFAQAGFDFLKFNFSHNGGTVENPIDFPDLDAFSKNTYSRELEDLDSIFELIEKGIEANGKRRNYKAIHLIGHSRGGGIAILFAAHRGKVSKLVTWAAVSDFAERFDFDLSKWKKEGFAYVSNSRTGQSMPHSYSFFEDFMEHRDELDIPAAARNIDIPWLVAHGINDESVCISNADRLINLSGGARLFLVKKAGHTFGGKHPWEDKDLPTSLEILVNKTIEFLKA
jgi:pimeloyl-ACP methyl ester carboxylesterase